MSAYYVAGSRLRTEDRVVNDRDRLGPDEEGGHQTDNNNGHSKSTNACLIPNLFPANIVSVKLIFEYRCEHVLEKIFKLLCEDKLTSVFRGGAVPRRTNVCDIPEAGRQSERTESSGGLQ